MTEDSQVIGNAFAKAKSRVHDDALAAYSGAKTQLDGLVQEGSNLRHNVAVTSRPGNFPGRTWRMHHNSGCPERGDNVTHVRITLEPVDVIHQMRAGL